jgi:NAD(P)-dependent dehydrogenase (short-subunit alcohol dehydrogenase family)
MALSFDVVIAVLGFAIGGPVGLGVACLFLTARSGDQLIAARRRLKESLVELETAKRRQRLAVAHLREVREMASQPPIEFDEHDELALMD